MNRPFRHLCPVADERDSMTEDEFWEHVFQTEGMPDSEPEPDATDELYDLPVTQCETCGTKEGSCGYDEEGRPYIHCT